MLRKEWLILLDEVLEALNLEGIFELDFERLIGFYELEKGWSL